MTGLFAKLLSWAIVITALVTPARAAIPTLESEAIISIADSGDTAWMLTATVLMLFLALPGLALFYGGRVQTRNFLSVILQCCAILAIISLVWIVVGYTLAFGEAGNGIIGSGNAWMMIGLAVVREGTLIPESAFAIFQMIIAIFAANIMVGAWVERARFGWVIAFCAFWSVIVYAPIAHWIWGDGWLSARGAIDYAGGMVIHITAGVSALVAAIMVGRRTGWPETLRYRHSPALALIGAGLIWVGWLALVGGNEQTAGDGAASAIMNAHIAASVSALVWILIERLTTKQSTAMGFAKGVVAGLVTISAAAGYISPGSAIIIGLAAAPICYFSAGLVKDVFAIDDSLDIFALHGIGGISGGLFAAVFVSESFGGLGYAEDVGMFGQIFTQIIAIATIVIWSIIGSLIIGFALSMVLPMRVSEDDEAEGLDKSLHGENAWELD